LLAVFVLTFAFLGASFAARNSDLWLHLATGRAIAGRTTTFGSDPFSYTTQGIYWANHAWLFDLALYAGFTSLGGAGLVAIKAALVALLAGLMLRIARHEGPFWRTGACVVLAVLAMTPRLLLQPTVLSLVLLALSLLLLREGGRTLRALPAVVVLWVNVDSWFWLGPLTVALLGAGQLLSREPQRLPMWLLPACLVACLVSPYHVNGLTLPIELSPGVWRSGLRHDARFAPLFASPWRIAPLGSTGGYNLAAWAYFVLLVLGVISFVLNRTALKSWRSLVWLTFGALGAWQARLVPFFAVVAGPITALNLQEIDWCRSSLPGRINPERPSTRGTFLGRLGLTATAIALIVLAWPGWLQGFHRRDLGVDWRVHTDPSLQRVTHSLADWRHKGAIPAGTRTFAPHPDVAHYLAWFFPEEKSFFDLRLSLFLPVAADYEKLCAALDSSPTEDRSYTSGWETILLRHNIATVVLYDPVLRRLAPALQQISQYPQRWELLRIDGQAVIFAWQGAPLAPPASLAFNAERAAFVRPKEAIAPPPPDEVPTLAEPRPWWQRYLHGYPESTWEAEAAAVYLRLFEDGEPSQFRKQRERVLARHAAGLAGLPASSGGIPSIVALTMRMIFADLFVPDLLERPPALPLLAVRAARRALASQPEQARAWLVLAQAYLALGRTTTESAAHARLAPLSQLRYIHTVTALVQAVTFDPDLAPAHAMLALLFAEHGYLDLALRHRTAQLRLERRNGRMPGLNRDAFATRIEHLEGAVEEMRKEVEDGENRFAVATATLAGEPLKRAQIALQNGLAAKAIDDVLLRSHADLYGVDGIRLLLELLLRTGRARDARDLLDRHEMKANPAGLGVYALSAGHRWNYRFGAYDWFDFCQSAAGGAIDRASAALQRLREPMRVAFDQNLVHLRRHFSVLSAQERGLGAVRGAFMQQLVARLLREQVALQLFQNDLLMMGQADLYVVEGMLLLEAGSPGASVERFRRSLPLYQRAAETAMGMPGREVARRYLERLQPAPQR
jgi:hypothetical protein